MVSVRVGRIKQSQLEQLVRYAFMPMTAGWMHCYADDSWLQIVVIPIIAG